MTEAEWLTCEDPRKLLNRLQKEASDRKLIMFSLACWTTPDYYSEPDWADAITQLTDGVLAGKVPLVRLIGLFGAFTFDFPPTAGQWARWVTQERPDPVPTELAKVAFIRDIFGNPFRPVSFSAEWRTSDVLLLAQGIYAERAFDRMPILADALQDSGCDNTDILTHLRDANATHVRGCWALDLVLGKE